MAINELLNKTMSTLRGGVGQATRAGRGAANQGIGLGKRLANRNPQPKSDMDDVTLARKVETEIFRGATSPKGKVDVNAVDGVVWLRGEVKNQAQLESLEAKVRAIPEVQDVENLLHLPKTPAPSRTRAGAKKATTARKTTTAKNAQSKRFDRPAKSAEQRQSSDAEPLPSQTAKSSTGRKAAPLGTQDTTAPSTTTPASVTGGTTPEPTRTNGGDSGTGSAS